MDNNTKVLKNANYLKFKNITCSLGNKKLSKNILIFNLPAVTTCPNNKDCEKTCYARKAENRYPSVLSCREKNYQASKKGSFINDMQNIILTATKKYNVKYIRVHESGDFYNKNYAWQWNQIASLFPALKFFAYTKSPFKPVVDNFNIVESILPNGSINYGTKKEIFNLAKKYKAKICPYGMGQAGKKALCGVKCFACMNNQYVLFLQH